MLFYSLSDSLIQTDCGKSDHINIAAIDQAVTVQVPLGFCAVGGFNVPGQFEGIEDVHSAVLVDIDSLCFVEAAAAAIRQPQ